ncbi:hypothetical protein MTR67_030915 [Solanum verrucosum]|uniref:Uncharacterized protein n=1 Tax=Solanum verrucosum TaxID=315347 RepID=A0AAF0U1H5_SOLVR|nr:hypothetical protein MTR67_030915 [Solanum verrucosum]
MGLLVFIGGLCETLATLLLL